MIYIELGMESDLVFSFQNQIKARNSRFRNIFLFEVCLCIIDSVY